MKYCEVVRDLANKSGDWSFYDEQFRYLRQSSPELYPSCCELMRLFYNQLNCHSDKWPNNANTRVASLSVVL